MESQLSASKKEAKDCLNEHDVVLKANFNIAQELRRVNGELKETQMKCTELEGKWVDISKSRPNWNNYANCRHSIQ